MRRAQVDGRSLPVWNYCTNPSFEVASGTQVLRTNFAPDPRMTATTLGGYGAQTLSTVTGLGSNPDGITTAVRVSYGAGAANAGALIMGVPDVSTQYTITAWVWNEGVTSENISIAHRGAASGGTQLVPQNVWTKLTWTITTQSSFGAGNEFGVRIGATAAAGSFLVTGIMIEKAPASLGDFFDGASGTVGDFTHAWNGTANASSSRRQAPTVSGVVTNAPTQSLPYQSSDRPMHGTKFCRWFLTTGSTAIGFNIVDVDNLPLGNISRTWGIWVRPSVAMTIQPRLRNDVSGVNVNLSSSVALPANVWTLLKGSSVQNITDPNTSLGLVMATGAGQAYGATVDVDAHWIREGVDDFDYVEGSHPFARWEGSANSSASVGYAQQLYDIAGKPSVDLVGVANTGGVAIPVAPYAARTLYVVYESSAITANYSTCFYYGVAATKGFVLQTAAAGSSSMANRFDFPGGSSNGAIVFGSGRLSKRYVAAFAFAEGLTSVKSCLSGNVDVNTSPAPGSGWDDGRAQTMNGTDLKPIRAMVYYADHDRNTRLAISRYLGNKYGAAIA